MFPRGVPMGTGIDSNLRKSRDHEQNLSHILGTHRLCDSCLSATSDKKFTNRFGAEGWAVRDLLDRWLVSASSQSLVMDLNQLLTSF